MSAQNSQFSGQPLPSLTALKATLNYFSQHYHNAPGNDVKRTLFAIAARQLANFSGTQSPYFVNLLPFANF